MRDDAIFLNGVYESVLHEILVIQGVLPEHILFLQPYKAKAIADLRDAPPTVDDPVRLFMSVTTDLPTVRFKAEIVGWDDKRTLDSKRRKAIERVIWTLQPNEGGLYDFSKSPSSTSVNLLHIRRLEQISKPFNVSRLINAKDGSSLSPKRTTAGSWVYVRNP